MKLNELSKVIRNSREEKGFYTPCSIDTNFEMKSNEAELMLGKLMLVVSEVGEASEAVRKGDISNFKEELADTIIRILDICGTMGIDIEEEVKKKMCINENREFRHGKKTSL